jgi:hypothetical protein
MKSFRFALPISLLIGLLALACTDESLPPPSEGSIKPVLISKKVFQGGSRVEVRINAISQEGNILTINVTYGGGCVQHSPDLVWGKELGKSLPITAPLKLVFYETDNCYALITQSYSFDLKNLFQATNQEVLAVPMEGWDKTAFVVSKP